MKKVYIVFSQTYTVLATAIKLTTKEKYSHMSLAIDNPDKMYSFGRKYSINPIIGRFVKEDLNKGLYKKNRVLIKVIEKDITDKQYNEIKKLLKYYEDNKKIYKYNILGLIYVKHGIKKERKNKLYCAEFVYKILSDDNIKIIKKINEPIKVNNIINEEDFKCIYEGKAKDYLKNK